MNKLSLSAVIFVLFSQAAFAAYDIQLKLSKSDKVINEGRMRVESGVEGSLVSETNFVEVVAIPNGSAISLTIVAGVTNEDGARTIVNKFQVSASNGRPATVIVGKLDNPSEKVTLVVTAKNVP